MRAGSFRRMSEQSEIDLLTRLTPRDVAICQDVHEHRVLTSLHVRQLHFAHERTARRRLNELSELGVLRRFRPYRRPGSAPWHYFLGDLGARVLAAHTGGKSAEFSYRRVRLLAIAGSRKLAHLLGVNDFFCALAGLCRSLPGHELVEWWGEGRCLARWGEYVAPDGFAVLRCGDATVGFFLEYDRGTEERRRLIEKVERYSSVARLGEPAIVLFCAESDRREENIRSALESPGLTVATSTIGRHLARPLGRNWWVVGGRGRLSLTDLRDGIGTSGAR